MFLNSQKNMITDCELNFVYIFLANELFKNFLIYY
jgi:hypothetical protein